MVMACMLFFIANMLERLTLFRLLFLFFFFMMVTVLLFFLFFQFFGITRSSQGLQYLEV
jgi:hypothetical protein